MPMTLDEILGTKLADWRPPDGRHDLTVSEGGRGWAVTITADRCDDLGCLVWELELDRGAGTPRRGIDLSSWAQNVVNRVTGLLEPLKVVEIDPVRNEGLLRSNTAARRGDKLCYYEVILIRTTAAQVRRYQAEANGTGRREQVAFALTHEALAKLTRDLTADQ
jgi:hypothetical protein